MPVLHHFRNRDGAYAKAWINGSIVTFQLTDRGHERLEEGGLGDGATFPLNWLIDLIHDRDAYTREGDAAVKAGRHEAEQFVFDFAENEEAQKALPVCEETGSFDDLHLVVYGDHSNPVAQLLAPDARALAQKISLNIPLGLLNARDLDRLIASSKLPENAACVERLKDFFSRTKSERWEKMTGDSPRQEQLSLEDELRLM